jgi:hypothetical protein
MVVDLAFRINQTLPCPQVLAAAVKQPGQLEYGRSTRPAYGQFEVRDQKVGTWLRANRRVRPGNVARADASLQSRDQVSREQLLDAAQAVR